MNPHHAPHTIGMLLKKRPNPYKKPQQLSDGSLSGPFDQSSNKRTSDKHRRPHMPPLEPISSPLEMPNSSSRDTSEDSLDSPEEGSDP